MGNYEDNDEDIGFGVAMAIVGVFYIGVVMVGFFATGSLIIDFFSPSFFDTESGKWVFFIGGIVFTVLASYRGFFLMGWLYERKLRKRGVNK